LLIESDLRNARLLGADLSGATLSGANLSGASLPFVDLRNARLVGTTLENVDFSFTDLGGADMSMATVTGALFEPNTLPRVETLAEVKGLETLRWQRSQQALVALRSTLKLAGMQLPALRSDKRLWHVSWTAAMGYFYAHWPLLVLLHALSHQSHGKAVRDLAGVVRRSETAGVEQPDP
jgi:hypothetical protein